MLITTNLNFNGVGKLERPLLAPIAPTNEGELSWNNLSKKIRVHNGTNASDILDGSDISANADFTQDTSLLANRGVINNLINTKISALGTIKGGFNASSGIFPTGAKAGDFWIITTAGTFVGLTPVPQVSVGDVLYARINNPATASDWFVLQSNFSTSQDIIVGGTFTPSAGTLSGSDSVKTAFEKLQGNITAGTLTAGNGLSVNTGQIRLGGALTQTTLFTADSAFNLRMSFTNTLLPRTDFFQFGYNGLSFNINSNQLFMNSTNCGYNGLAGQSNFLVTAQNISLQTFTIGSFILNSSGAIFTDVRTTTTGIEYAADYSLSFAQNSLVTKQYVDNLVSGLAPKESARVATTANITLSGLQTIDGITLVANNRVLVKNQTNAIENGVYVASATAWTRASDFDDINNTSEVRGGSYVFVTQGTQSATGWIVIAGGDVVVGTDNINFVQVSASTSYGFENGLSLFGNTAKLGGTLTENTMLNGAGLYSLRGTGLTAFRMDTTSTTMALDTLNFIVGIGANQIQFSGNQGIVYNNDFSATFVNESLITKRYADTKAKFFSQDVNIIANVPLTITHNMNLGNQNDCIVQLWVGNNLVIVDVNTLNQNSLQVTSVSSQTGRLSIVGR